MEKYDTIIIGGGPAGLSAAIYAGRYKLKTLVLDPLPGGILNSVPEIQNWPGLTKVKGMELAQNLTEHAKTYGAEIKNEMVTALTKKNNEFIVKSKNEYSAKTILFATGTKEKEIGIKNEEKYKARGVHYCTACDAPFYQDKTTAIIGGSNSAVSGALFLAKYAKKVSIIYRKDKFTKAEPTLVEEMEKDPKIEIIFNANVKEIKGSEQKVERIILDTGKELEIDGLFIEVGRIPLIDMVKEFNVAITENGRIKIDPKQATSVSGLYAAGDITNGSAEFDQLVTAASEGTIAASSIFEYCQKNK